MSDPRDYKVEVGGPQPQQEPSTAAAKGRPYLSVRFDCCKVYLRIYRSPDGGSYSGRCPKCGKPVKFLVGGGGTSARFFVVE